MKLERIVIGFAVFSSLAVAFPAYSAHFAWHQYNFSGVSPSQVWADTIVPDVNNDIAAFGRNYYYLQGNTAGNNRYFQVGVTEGRNWGVYFKEFFQGWVDSNGNGQYIGLGGGGTPAGQAINLHIEHRGNNNWRGNVYSYGVAWYGQDTNLASNGLTNARVVAKSEGCSSTTYWDGMNVRDKHPFSYALFFNSSSGSWYYWPSSFPDREFDPFGCDGTPNYSGQLSNGSNALVWTYK